MPSPRRLHPAWIVLGALTLCMLASTGVRAVFGVYIKPIEDEMHWSRGALSTAAAVSLLLLGAAGPDRKSTRLNSSHVRISYAVFCLKKKKRQRRSCSASDYTTTA